jgi:hypothetical protein
MHDDRFLRLRQVPQVGDSRSHAVFAARQGRQERTRDNLIGDSLWLISIQSNLMEVMLSTVAELGSPNKSSRGALMLMYAQKDAEGHLSE